MLGRCSSRAPSTTLRLQVPRRPIPPCLALPPVHARVHCTMVRPVAPRPAQRPASRLTTHRGGLCSAHRGAPPPCSTGPLRAATDDRGRPPGARRAAAWPRAPPPGRSRPAPPPTRRAAQRAAGAALPASCTPSWAVDLMVWLILATPARVGCAPELYKVIGAVFSEEDSIKTNSGCV